MRRDGGGNERNGGGREERNRTMNTTKAILLCAAVAACAATAAETDGTAAAGNAERATLAGIVRNALADGFASNRADRCRAVVLDAKTGEILADESIGGDEAWLEARFEIGTLAVPFLAAAALDAGVVQTNTALDVVGPDVEGIPLADHPGFSGTITMDEAVAFSSNRGSARLALALGPERAARALEAFGFRVARSFDGETDEKRTFGTVRLAVGHFVLGNATEIAGAISAFANGGTPVEARTAGVGPVAPKAPAVSADACGTVREFLRKTVRDGTGTRAAVPGLDVAGKTGTIPIPDDRRYTQRHRSMFAGFFDAGGRTWTVFVVFDLREGVAETAGGRVAAPVFAKIASSIRDLAAVAGCTTAPGTVVRATWAADGSADGVDRMVLREAIVAERELADAGIADYMDFLKDNHDAVTAGGAGGSREFKSKYDVVYVDRKKAFFSYRIEFYAYTGGAHGSEAVFAGTVDSGTMRKLSVADAIPEDKRDEALGRIRKAVAERIGGEDRLQHDVTLTENFCVAEDGLHFVFRECEIASYSHGTIEVVIPAYGKYAVEPGE